MSEDILEDLMSLIIVFGLTLFVGLAFYTTEYEIKRETSCLEYSTNTGKCTKEEWRFVCSVEHGGEVVAYCGKDIEKCNSICERYNREMAY